jgi:hypothetical protein
MNGSELVFIVTPIVIPLVLIIGIASELRPSCLRRPRIRSGSPARSWAPVEQRFRSSSVSR